MRRFAALLLFPVLVAATQLSPVSGKCVAYLSYCSYRTFAYRYLLLFSSSLVCCCCPLQVSVLGTSVTMASAPLSPLTSVIVSATALMAVTKKAAVII